MLRKQVLTTKFFCRACCSVTTIFADCPNVVRDLKYMLSLRQHRPSLDGRVMMDDKEINGRV
jgi:hypothetical protein